MFLSFLSSDVFLSTWFSTAANLVLEQVADVAMCGIVRCISF